MAKIQETQKPEQASVDLTSVLARLDSIEAENQRLKAQLNPENKHTK
jgi:cell shape-determining protein MreC